MRSLLLMIWCCIVHGAWGQDMNGIWRGKLTQEPGGCYPEYFIELQIRHDDSTIKGVTYDYYDTARFIKLTFNGQVNLQTGRMVLTENKVTQVRIPKECTPCVKTYDLTLHKAGTEEILTGTWHGVKAGTTSGCPPGNIVLKRVSQSAFVTEEASKETEQALLKLGQRKIEIVKTINLDTSGITLELYDNGQIDGDTISIFLNRRLILYKGGLTAKPITLKLPVTPSTDYDMIMYAENLGSIPPNTALMVVTAGVKKYEIYLSSSNVKSAAVKFRYDKKP